MNLAEIDIDQIVRDVMKQIHHNAESPSIPAKVTEPARVTEMVQIAGRVITADLLSEKVKASRVAKGTVVEFEQKAIITPAARDYMKEHKLQISTGIQTKFVEKNRTSRATERSWLSLLVKSSESLGTAVDAVARKMGNRWAEQACSTNEIATQLAIENIESGTQAGVFIFTDKPAIAACLVNRSEKVRGVVVRSEKELCEAFELNANVICVPGRGLSFTEYRNILRSVMITG